MRELVVILKRKHYPEELDKAEIGSAYGYTPCIMDKVLADQCPELASKVKVGAFGHLLEKPKEQKWLGQIQDWEYVTAIAIGAEFQKNPEAQFPFTIKLEDYETAISCTEPETLS